MPLTHATRTPLRIYRPTHLLTVGKPTQSGFTELIQVRLTPLMERLLTAMLERPGRPHKARDLEWELLGACNLDAPARGVYSAIRDLRRRLREAGLDPSSVIYGLRGVGFVVPAAGLFEHDEPQRRYG